MVHIRFVALALCLLGASYFVNPSIAFRYELQELDKTTLVQTGVDSLLKEDRKGNLTITEVEGATWTDAGSTSAKALHQHQPAGKPVGIWVHVVPDLTKEMKTSIVTQKLPSWLPVNNRLAEIVLPSIAERVPLAMFAEGLSKQLEEEIRKGVGAAGIQCDLETTVDEDGVSMLITIADIDKDTFDAKNLNALGISVIANLLGKGPNGEPSLQETLEDNAVPNAEVQIYNNAQKQFSISIVARKGQVLAAQIPKKLTTWLAKKGRAGRAAARIVPARAPVVASLSRKLGGATTSKSIAKAMVDQIKKKMKDQLLSNGITAEIEGGVSIDNGEKHERNKQVVVTIDVQITGIDKKEFLKTKRVVVRNSVVEQLTRHGPGGLEFELDRAKFGAHVAIETCGWGGCRDGKCPMADGCADCSKCSS